MISLKCRMLTLASLIACNASAGVYVSYDSVATPLDRQMQIAQMEHTAASTAAIERSAQTTEFVMGELVKYNKETAALASEKMERVYNERTALIQDRNQLTYDQNQLIAEKKALESQRYQMEKQYQDKNLALIARNAATQQSILEEQKLQQQDFYNTQQRIQSDTLALQQQVKEASDDLLAEQLKLNSPSNVIVIASKQASNVKATVQPQDLASMDNVSPTSTLAPLVNMNEFIRQILPAGWRYTPPAGSSNKYISLVQGKDWKSIITTIGVQHPYLQIAIDPYAKTLAIHDSHATKRTRTIEPMRTWQVSPAKSLKETINDFAIESGWQLIWDTENVDYPILAHAVLKGDFSGVNGVVNQLMLSTQNQDFPLVAKWAEQNKVVRIQRRKSRQK
ncbi:TcpQ domain-containing protein [Vibrio sp. TRT 29B02]|uniref:TcpQ domain-containing protein n=1 Tax=Vibrio sp. TRT 29B02 TaxID=3418508 RepID=UPI003CED5CCD